MAIRRRKLTLALIRRAISTEKFQKFYFILSLIVLGATTIYWSLIGSWIQAGNADQLANSYLMENGQTFNGAVLPDQHTFIFKVPFFWLTQLLGGGPIAFSVVTVLVVTLTVGLFAFILYKLQPQKLIISTIYLGLALVLIMIPAEPHASSLLPSNMAMLTTRNLEYILFIGAAYLVVTTQRWGSLRPVIALLLMILLIASDKLFLSIGIGGALLFGIIAIIRGTPHLRIAALRWFLVSVISSFAALLLLHIVTASRLLHLDGHNVASPYEVIQTFSQAAAALFYGVLGFFTNFGANPGYDTRDIGAFFVSATPRLFSVFSYAYIGTITILITIIVAIVMQFKKMFKKNASKKVIYTPAATLSLILIATSVAAIGAYLITNHYYPVDSRYMAVVMFAGFVVLASFSFRKRLPALRLVAIGAALFLLTIPALAFPVHTLEIYNDASSDLRARNTAVSKTLALHKVDTLLGNYWRVLPIKLLSHSQRVSPLQDCTTDRTVLSSEAWRVDLHKNSFAYLLTLDTPTNFPSCSLEQITTIYGRPDSSVVVSGTPKDPKELLLFYDKGIHKTRKVNIEHQAPDTVVPVELGNMPFRECEAGRTIMNFIAHEDDDILFMNPDLNRDIKAGNCVRSVFLTAGDAGADTPYWLGRQKGAEKAYASMLGTPDVAWTERVVEILPDHFAVIANPRNSHRISLVFLHLPDGNMNGHGFGAKQSIARLYSGQVGSLSTVDSQSTYTSAELQKALLELLKAYSPNEIRSQSAAAGAGRYVDHSDHTTVGRYMSMATTDYTNSSPQVIPTVTYYLGYPIRDLPPNVVGSDFDIKAATFFEFSKYDAATCGSIETCDHGTAYGDFLRRQYTNPN